MRSVEEEHIIIDVSLLLSVIPSKTTSFLRRDIDIRSHYSSYLMKDISSFDIILLYERVRRTDT